MAEIIDATSGAQNSTQRDLRSAVSYAHVAYGLHALAPFTMLLLAVVAIIVGAIKRDDVRDTWLETHFSWLARTFWWGLLWWIVSWCLFWLLTIVTLGFGALLAWIFPASVFLWYLYRVIVGWLRLGDLKPIA